MKEPLWTHPLHPTHSKTNKCLFKVEWGQLAYESFEGIHVVAGPPLGDSFRVLDAFIQWSHSRGLGVCGYYFSESTSIPEELQKYQIGVSRALSLPAFHGRGEKWCDFRRAINQGHRFCLDFKEVYDLSRNPSYMAEVVEIENQWKKKCKVSWGRWWRTRRLGFLLSSVTCIDREERLFEVREEGRIAALVSLLPYQVEGGRSYYIDTLIQSPTAHRFALDFLLSQLIWRLKGEGAQHLNFGLCAFQKIKRGSFLEWMTYLHGRSNFLYNSQGLYQYKKKFTDTEEREYLLMDSQASFFKQLRALYKVTWRYQL